MRGVEGLQMGSTAQFTVFVFAVQLQISTLDHHRMFLKLAKFCLEETVQLLLVDLAQIWRLTRCTALGDNSMRSLARCCHHRCMLHFRILRVLVMLNF